LDTAVDFVERRDPDVHMFAQNAPLWGASGFVETFGCG
jgi:hypothetical protein